MSGDLKLVKIPQLLGAALAGNIFVILAFEFAKIQDFTTQKTIVFFSIFAFNLKDFFDDMKGYEVERIEGFSLFPTIFFRAISYMALASAIALMNIELNAFYALSAYFLTFVIWSINSVIRRMRLSGNSAENLERLRRRRGWIGIYSLNAGICFAIASFDDVIYLSIGLMLLLSFYLFDVRECGSFSSGINETL